MKKIAVVIVAVFGLTFLQPVQAQINPSIAIIDTAIDATVAEAYGKVVYEVCITERSSCPNGTGFQEGKGAATLNPEQIEKNGFSHGTSMTAIAGQVNPNINVVFIRIVGINPSGTQQQYTDKSVISALNWVKSNKDNFNIVAVSASVGKSNFKTLTEYCPVNPELRSSIISLQNINVATIFAAGNKYDYSRVDYPSCIAEAISVGATDRNTNRISLYSNGGPDLDFYALGAYRALNKNHAGTSASTVALASYWAKHYKGSYSLTYDYFKSISKETLNSKLKSSNFIDILN
jgi:hypothetical protein